MRVDILTEQDHVAYDHFTAKNGGSVVQSCGWGAFRGKFWALAVKEGTTWMGSALVVKRLLPFGLSWLSIERGPIFAGKTGEEWKVWEEVLVKLKALAKKERAVFVRVEPPLDCALNFEASGLRKAHAHYQPEWSLRVDL